MSVEPEIARIKAEYDRRAREIPGGFYDFDRPANLFALHGRERALRDALAWHGALPLANRTVLEIGCGAGEWFNTFSRLGLPAQHQFGIELDSARAADAKATFPLASIVNGDATRLPWPNASFDLVFQSTVFTSVLEAQMKQQLASEMLRVLKPGGAVLWYDFVYDNPFNKQVKGVSVREVKRLFGARASRFYRTTLAPPLARRLVPLSWPLASALEQLKLLNTHVLGVLVP